MSSTPTTNPGQPGFSLIEAMLAAGAFSLIVTTLAGALVFGQQSSIGSGKRSRAVALAEEGIEAVRSIRDQAFNELQYAQSGVGIASNTWAFAGEGSTEMIDEFTRTTTFVDVCRNGSKTIVACPGTYVDPHTKQVSVAVSWSGGTVATGSVSRATYLTDWEASKWTQTDWAGGSGQSTWSNATRYDTDDGNVAVSPAGELTLEAAGSAAPWWDITYGFRQKISFGTSHTALVTGYTVPVVMDTRPANTNVELTSGNDVRIIWQPTVGAALELDRIGSAWNSATSNIEFRLQSDITANSNDDADGSYYAYYGNSVAGTPPSNEMNVYYFADFFNRANSSTIGNGWTEWVTGGGNVSIASNAASVLGNNTGPSDAGIKQTFPLGAITGDFTVEYAWTMPSNPEGIWTHYLNIGSTSMTDSSRTTGVGPGIYAGEGSHFAPNGIENISNDLSGNMENSINGGPHAIKLVVDATNKDYDYYRGGTLRASNQNWVNAGATINQIRIATDQYINTAPAFVYDTLKLTLNVADAPEGAMGAEQMRAITDDTQAEFDTGTYTATQYDAPNAWAELTAAGQTAGTGNYTSEVFDSGVSATWDTLQWLPQRPTGKELPNSTGTNNWWDGAYLFRKKVLLGTAHTALSNGHTLSVTMDTQPSATNVELTSGNDVRVVWQPNTGDVRELDRIGSAWNSATSVIDFRLQSAISANLDEDVDGSYYIYYGNAAASTPPTDEQNVYYFADFFNRADSSTVGGGWTEWVTGGGDVSIVSNTASIVGNNVAAPDAGIKQTFGLGNIPGSFTLNFDWTMPTNSEGEWTNYLNIGNSASMVDTSRTTGVGPGIYNGEGAHFSPNGTENISNDLSGNMENSINGGPHAIRMVINRSAQTYSYYRNSVLIASGQTYVSAQTTLNQIRIATDLYAAGQPAFVYDNVKLTLDVANVPEPSLGTESSPATQSESGYGAGNLTMANNWLLYHLNESVGVTSFAESSGNSVTATCSGGNCPVAGATGKLSNALDFDGTDDYLTLGSGRELSGSTATFSAWVRPDAYGTDPYVISKASGTGTGGTRWSLGFNNLSSTSANVQFRLRTGSTTTTLNSSTSYGVGSWLHIVGRYDGATMKIYVNGTEVGSTAQTGQIDVASTIDIRVSSHAGGAASRPFDGLVDEVGVWNRALSPAEIVDSYQRAALRLKLQVRSCDDAACVGEPFVGSDGTAATYYSEITNTSLTPPAVIALAGLSANRYFQYQVTLETDSASLSPELKNVTIGLTPSGSSGYVAAGSLVSSAFNLSDNSPVEIVEWDESIPSCSPTCTVKLQVRTAPDASGSPGTWTAWYGATGSGTYFTANTGTRIPMFLNGNRWVQYRVELAGDGISTPTLQETRLFYR